MAKFTYKCKCGYEEDFIEKFGSPPQPRHHCGIMNRKILPPIIMNKSKRGYNNYGMQNPDFNGIHGFSEPTIEAYGKMKEEDSYHEKHGEL